MLWKVFYILGLLAQYSHGYEIEENEDVLYELLSPEDYDVDLSPVLNYSESDHDHLIASEELLNDADLQESPAEESISFAGPVKARGTVSIAATFAPGPANYPSFSTVGPVWFPPAFFQQYFFPPSSQPESAPMPTFSHIPLITTFGPGMESSFSENVLKNSQNKMNVKADSKEIFLEISPVIEMPVASTMANISVESLSPDEILESPVAFLDDEFTDYDEMEGIPEMPVSDDLKLKEPGSSPCGIVFGGFVPASGSVKIAARF